MADVAIARPVAASKTKGVGRSAWLRPWITTLLYSIAVIATLLFINRNATDYVGADNDDAMRLVEIRDLLAGQSWFDMTQYRLGLDGGTLMHWSRFIDLPIGALISFFRLFAAPEHAEALALTIWPLVLILPLMAFMGLAGRRIAGLPGLHISLGLTAITVVTTNRFTPGSIDHDNVQLCLAALIAAMLVDDRFRPWCFAVAGVASAIALAIGAETTPLVAVACIAVATVWAFEGEAFAPAARAFALALTLAVSAAFLSTVPPHLYSTVTCDNLSLGFYGITSVGSIGLLLAAVMANRLSRPLRFAVLAAVGAIVLATELALAPQCLRSPLSNLDPLLVQLWLNNISEAQSILALVRTEPTTVGAFYATGFLGSIVCIFRILRGERRQLYAILLALLLVNWLIAIVQVRGALFANLMAIPPLTLFIADLRRLSNSDPENVLGAFLYVAGVLASVPAVWAVGGSLATGNVSNLFTNAAGTDPEGSAACSTREALAPIAHLDPGVVLAPSNLGAPILRFTPHRALSGPYHRDQAGMLAEIHIGLAKPAEAEAFLREAKVTLFVYCAGDPQNEQLSRLRPDGLYAELAAGRVPAYLKPLSQHDKASVQFFRFVP